MFLFLARAADGRLLPALSSLASQQANPTEKTMGLCKQFLDFMSTQEDTVLTYQASNMVLAIHSDALYLSKPNPAAAPVVTCTWREKKKSPSTTGQSSTSHK